MVIIIGTLVLGFKIATNFPILLLRLHVGMVRLYVDHKTWGYHFLVREILV